MKEKVSFDLIRFFRAIDDAGIRCLLIGRWAVAQHGAPVVTADYDFWVDPRDRARFFGILENVFEAELPPEYKRSEPVVTVYVGADKIDCFFFRRMINDEGEELVFEQFYRRSEEKKDPGQKIRFRIPSIDDLIALKKFASRDKIKDARNREDIRFLLTLKKHKTRG